MTGFFSRLREEIETKDSVVCVGLDPVPNRIPDDVSVREFNRRIIEATSDVAAAYKPNAAFYESLDPMDGGNGWDVLLETVEEAGFHAPVVLDAKRGDIGNSSRRYAELLDVADAITVNPYMGRDSLQPFLERGDSGVFVLCKTTNTGSSDLQDLECSGRPVYHHVAEKAVEWDSHDNVGLVVGATHPEAMEELRNAAGDLPWLVPGVGAQGGDEEAAVEYGTDSSGVGLVNSTRGIIYSGDGVAKFDEAAREAAKKLRSSLNRYR